MGIILKDDVMMMISKQYPNVYKSLSWLQIVQLLQLLNHWGFQMCNLRLILISKNLIIIVNLLNKNVL